MPVCVPVCMRCLAACLLQCFSTAMLFQVLLKVPGMQDLVEALASYTQRHFVRMDRLVRSSFLLDYTLASMNVLMPEEDSEVLAANALDEPEGVDSDLDESTGTDVDTDAFLQPAADIQADEDLQAVLPAQDMVPVESGAQEQASELQGGVDLQNEHQQPTDHAVKKTLSRRRKSAPQAASSNPAATPIGSKTAVKAKRRKVI